MLPMILFEVIVHTWIQFFRLFVTFEDTEAPKHKVKKCEDVALPRVPSVSVSGQMEPPLCPQRKAGFMCFSVVSLETLAEQKFLVSPVSLLTSVEVSREENSEILVIKGQK